jgi:Flp pilus assembly protein TadG
LINTLSQRVTTMPMRGEPISPASRWGEASRPSRRFAGKRATAALEFAMASPLLMVMLGGAADLGLAQYDRVRLANAVGAGAEYAYLKGVTVTTASITSIVQLASNLPSATNNVAVVYTGVSPGVPSPGWYCLTGSGPTVTSSMSGGTCNDGSAAGYYISLKASYVTTGLMHGFMSAASQTMSEQATVKLQ